MYKTNNNSRVLGIAFLLQLVVSVAAMITGIIIEQKLIVPDNMGESLINIANKTCMLKANILGEMFTTVTIIFLGSLLFATLRKTKERAAVAALGFYILGAAILAVSRLGTFSLIKISQEYIASGNPAHLISMANQAWNTMDYGTTLLMLPFCFGATIFYFLFYKSRLIPRIFSLWGLISACLLTLISPFVLYGKEMPMILMALYAPVDPAIGIWLLVKGIKEKR